MWCVVWDEAEGQSELHHEPSAEVGNGDAEEEDASAHRCALAAVVVERAFSPLVRLRIFFNIILTPCINMGVRVCLQNFPFSFFL